MAESAVPPIQARSYLSNTTKLKTGASLIGTGALALGVGGLFVAIYFSKGASNTFNLNHLPGSLVGRLAFGLPLASGLVLVSGGVAFVCVSKRKPYMSDPERILKGGRIGADVVNTDGNSSSSPDASPPKSRAGDSQRRNSIGSSNSNPPAAPPSTPNHGETPPASTIETKPEGSPAAQERPAETNVPANENSNYKPAAQAPVDGDTQHKPAASAPAVGAAEHKPAALSPNDEESVSEGEGEEEAEGSEEGSVGNPAEEIYEEVDPARYSPTSQPQLPIVEVNEAPKVALTPETLSKFQREIAKPENEQDKDFVQKVLEAVKLRKQKALEKAQWVNERFKVLKINTGIIKYNKIVIDPKTLILAREICQGIIEGLSFWLNVEEKAKILQTMLIGRLDKSYEIELESENKPKLIDNFSITTPQETGILQLFSHNSFQRTLENSVKKFTLFTVKNPKSVQYNKNEMIDHFQSLSVAEKTEEVNKLKQTSLYKETVETLKTSECGEILRQLLVLMSQEDPQNQLNEKFINPRDIETLDKDVQDLILFKYLSLIFTVGNYDENQAKKELQKQLDIHANLSHASRTYLSMSEKLIPTFGFASKFKMPTVRLSSQLIDNLQNVDLDFTSIVLINDPFRLDKCKLYLFFDHKITSETSNESILAVGDYLNPSMNESVKADIKERSKKLVEKLKEYNTSLSDNVLKDKLKHTRLEIALLITNIRMYVGGSSDKFEKNDADLNACLESIRKVEATLEEISKTRSRKLQSLIEKHQNYTQVLKAGLLVCLQQTQAEKADAKKVRQLKTQKYAISLVTLKKELTSIIQNDPNLKGYRTIEGLKQYADANKSDGSSDSYWGMVLDYSRWIAEKAYIVNAQERDYRNELFISISAICGALLDDRSVDNDPNRYEDDQHLNRVRDLYIKKMLPALSHGIGLFEEGHIQKPFDQLKNVFYELAYHMYSSINLDENLLSLLDAFSDNHGSPVATHANEHPLISGLKKCYADFSSLDGTQAAPFLDRTWRSAKNNNHVFYPNHEGNPTHVLFPITLKAHEYEKSIMIKAYGSPTVENGKGTAKICNEFKAHLEVMAQRKLKHMHVTFQNSIPVASFMGTGYYLNKSDETDRNNAIVGLQEEKRFYDNYFSIILAKDSNFYHQKNGVPGLYTSYKDELLFQFFGHFSRIEEGCKFPDKDIKSVTGCYIPDKIVRVYGTNGQIKEVFASIADAIHKTVFEGKDNLTVDEKKKFTELFYSCIILRIATEIDVDSLSGVCKDMIDRGMMAIVRLYVLCAAANGKQKANEMFERRLKAYTMIRAYLVRKRSPLVERFDRMIEDYEFILKNQDKIIELFKAVFPGLEISV